jgi:hypothetical protein
VRPIRDALAAQGFEVFWDQQVPAGMDWDTWIRQHLIKSMRNGVLVGNVGVIRQRPP